MIDNNLRQREKPEPSESNASIPWYIWTLVFFAVLWGVGYLSPATLERDLSMPDMSATVDGGQIYAGNCAACHQGSGAGLPGMFPPLANSEWVLGDPEVLVQILLHGVTGEMEVAGVTYNGMMPGFGGQFDDAQVAAVASYIRNSWGNGAEAVTAEQVAAARAATADRQGPWQGQAELQALGSH